MSRPNGVADELFDEAGFEVPFAGSFEVEALSESETTFGAETESPFAELTFEAEPFEAEDFDSESLAEAGVWSEAEAEYAEGPLGEDETFPSGLELQPASGATGRDEEHWDPHQTGIPLLATGPDVQPQKISPHFTVRELVTSGGKAAPVARISPQLVRVLELIRVCAGKPVRITSGYRSWARNKAVYAARSKKPTDSRHCSGQAADISVKGMSGLALGKLAIDAAGTNLGIGIGNTFIHVDVRGSWAKWTYFPRGGDADRTALAELSAHRTRALRGGKPAPVPPVPNPPRPQPAPTPFGGPSGRLVVAQHPMLRKHNGTPPDLILRWHRITQPGDIDVVVHFHGYGYKGQKTGVRIDRDKEKASGLDFSAPASPGSAGRTRPTLGILPRGNYFGGSRENAYNFPALMPKGALQQLIRDALARVTQATGHSVQMGRLILTGHSGGGAPLTAVLGDTDPDEVHVFDGLYGSSTAIGAWALRRIKQDLASPATPPPAMRILYLPGTKQYPGTQPNSEALARQIYPTLSSPAASRLQPYFRVEKTGVGHNDIPAKFGWRLLADAGANVPRATLYSGASGVTHEALFESYDKAGESFEPAGLEAEGEQLGYDETLAWLDVEALTDDAAAEAEGEGEAEAEAEAEWGAESDSEDEAESYDESESEGEAEAALSESEWGEAEEEAEEEEEVEDFVSDESGPALERDSLRAKCPNLPKGKDEVTPNRGGPRTADDIYVVPEAPLEYVVEERYRADEASPVFETESPTNIYKAKIKEALADLNPTRGPRNGFGPPFKYKHFNMDDWDEEPDLDMRRRYSNLGWNMLVLRRNRSPVAAIKRIVTQGHKWSLECAMFVQVVQLYALSQVDPVAYDRQWRNKGLRLRYFSSSGVTMRLFFDKEEKDGLWRAWFKKNGRYGLHDINNTQWTTQRILSEMDVGSRVMWRNNLIPRSAREDFRNENAVKVGPNQYRAFGLGTRSILSEAQLSRLLADVARSRYPGNNPSATLNEYARDNIFLSEAVSFKVK